MQLGLSAFSPGEGEGRKITSVVLMNGNYFIESRTAT